MSLLLPKGIRDSMPGRDDQESNRDPTVHIVFYFPLSEWIWFATEGEASEHDFLFYGYVVGLEREWGYFSLSELDSVNINGIKVLRDEDYIPGPLSECLKRYGLDEN